MKLQARGTSTRFDQPGEQARAARVSSPGPGLFIRLTTRWCARCQQDKPAAGSRRRGPLWICSDCVGAARA